MDKIEQKNLPVKSAQNNIGRDTTAKRRILGTGKTRLEVSALGFGCMGLNYHRGNPQMNRKERIELVHKRGCFRWGFNPA